MKSYGSPLTLSDFKPDKKDSFFDRVAQLSKTHSGLSITIASFGPIGPELLRALSIDGPDRQRVAHKLSEHGYLPEADAQALLGNIQITKVDEAALTRRVYSTLRNSLAGVNPETAFDLLHYWLFLCSERKTKLMQQDVIDRVTRVGKFAAERAAHHGQWFTAIVPIEDHALTDAARQELTDEFYRGVSTHYEHILADLDVVRSAKLEKMAEAFESARVVIVHGASGQGKTTLALCYLREYFPSQWRFQVKLIGEAMVRIDLMPRLFPDRERYASQGYGHHLWPSDLDVDDTQKTGIARKHLPPLWLTSVNARFRGLAEREIRPQTWPEYVQLMFNLRRGVVAALKQLALGSSDIFDNMPQ